MATTQREAEEAARARQLLSLGSLGLETPSAPSISDDLNNTVVAHTNADGVLGDTPLTVSIGRTEQKDFREIQGERKGPIESRDNGQGNSSGNGSGTINGRQGSVNRSTQPSFNPEAYMADGMTEEEMLRMAIEMSGGEVEPPVLDLVRTSRMQMSLSSSLSTPIPKESDDLSQSIRAYAYFVANFNENSLSEGIGLLKAFRCGPCLHFYDNPQGKKVSRSCDDSNLLNLPVINLTYNDSWLVYPHIIHSGKNANEYIITYFYYEYSDPLNLDAEQIQLFNQDSSLILKTHIVPFKIAKDSKESKEVHFDILNAKGEVVISFEDLNTLINQSCPSEILPTRVEAANSTKKYQISVHTLQLRNTSLREYLADVSDELRGEASSNFPRIPQLAQGSNFEHDSDDDIYFDPTKPSSMNGGTANGSLAGNGSYGTSGGTNGTDEANGVDVSASGIGMPTGASMTPAGINGRGNSKDAGTNENPGSHSGVYSEFISGTADPNDFSRVFDPLDHGYSNGSNFKTDDEALAYALQLSVSLNKGQSGAPSSLLSIHESRGPADSETKDNYHPPKPKEIPTIRSLTSIIEEIAHTQNQLLGIDKELSEAKVELDKLTEKSEGRQKAYNDQLPILNQLITKRAEITIAYEQIASAETIDVKHLSELASSLEDVVEAVKIENATLQQFKSEAQKIELMINRTETKLKELTAKKKTVENKLERLMSERKAHSETQSQQVQQIQPAQQRQVSQQVEELSLGFGMDANARLEKVTVPFTPAFRFSVQTDDSDEGEKPEQTEVAVQTTQSELSEEQHQHTGENGKQNGSGGGAATGPNA